MIAKKKKGLLGPVTLLLMSGLMVACDNNRNLEPVGDTPEAAWHRFWNLGRWKQTPKPYENEVELVSIQYKVPFTEGTADLDAQTVGDLHAFLREQGVRPDDLVSVDGPRLVVGGRTPLTTARIATLVEELNRTGLAAAVAPESTEAPQSLESDQIAVKISRYRVLSPECDAPDPELGDRPELYFTCSNTANLGAMIANPQDLARGQDPGASDAQRNAGAIDRYRNNAVTPIVTEGVSN